VIDPPELAWDVVERAGAPDRLLVLLHGYGEPPAQLVDRLDLLDPRGRFLAVVPAAPFERSGRAIWHRALSAPDEAEAQFRASLAALDRLLGALERELGRSAASAVVGGFSQGGGLGLALLLAADVVHRPAAAFGVCSFPPYVRGLRVDRAAATGRPALLTSARQDHFAPIERCRAGAVVLRDAGLELSYAETPGDHAMTDEAAGRVGAWLASLDDGAPSGRPHRAGGEALLEGVDGEAAGYAALWELVS
jgi:predicted esterase